MTIADRPASRPARRPRISVAVITTDRCELLARTLPTVLEQDFPAEGYEVVIVDDGSTDGTAAFLQRMSIERELVVLGQNRSGVSAARNAAASAASGEFILFLDDDLECDPGLLQAHSCAHASTADPLIVLGRLGVAVQDRPTLVGDWLRGAADAAHTRRSRSVSLSDAFVAANCSVSRDLLASCGGFDETFVNAREEHEVGLRLVRAGARPYYEPAAVTREVVRKSVHQLLNDAYAVGRNEVRLCRASPEYRRHSPLARLHEAPRWRGRMRRVVTSSRPAERALLAAPARLAFALGTTRSRAAGALLVGARYGASLRRGAMAEAGSWRALTEEFGRRLPVLGYHRVGPAVDGANPELTVRPRSFERHLRLLGRLGFTPVTPAAWLAWCRSATRLPRRPVLLTFDDAYADLSRYAFPSLVQAGYPAALFAPSARLGGENIWDEAFVSGSCLVTHRLLGPEDLLAWDKCGIEVGAHTRTHARLPDLEDDELVEEMVGSKVDLERLLRRPVSTFAYPFGSVDEQVRERAAMTFDAAFTIHEGLNTLATDPSLLRRSTVRSADTIIDVFFRLYLGWSPLHRISAKVGLIRAATSSQKLRRRYEPL